MHAIRVARGLSRAEVARRLPATTRAGRKSKKKATRMRVWRLESGATEIKASELPAIAKALETTVEALLGLEPA